jgi:LysM repeat protein
MVSRSGSVKLMDFGIARDPSFDDLTQTGTGLGTPSYMSPEQILGDRIDSRSDIFSLGIVLYQMVTGRKPFIEDEHKSVMHKIRLEKYPSPRKLNPEIPRELEKILARCMQKAPRDRWRSTQDLVLALERFLARRVDMNYHARLVQFLKNTGVVTAEEAQQYLPPTIAANGPSPPGLAGNDVVRRAAMVQGLIAGAAALTVGLIHLAPVGARGPVTTQAIVVPTATFAVPERPRGRVRVVANPWAEVWVDGRLVDTTPFAVPLDLEAGAHTVTLRNPWYADSERAVEIAAGDDNPTLVVNLTGRKVPPRPASPARPARPEADVQRPILTHKVRKGDTFELLAAEYYGSRAHGVFVLLANGLSHPRPLRPGEKLQIPTTWKYRIVEGDTLSTLAQRYLGDLRRAPFLAEFNQIDVNATLAIGDELTIPYHATHTAAAREDLASLAATFYRDAGKAELLRRYNFRSPKPLAKGDTIIVPLMDVYARQPEDPEAERRARRQREMTANARGILPAAQEAWRAGDYAAVRQTLVTLDDEYLDPDTGAAAAFLLGEAYIALGDRDSARRMFGVARERRPDLVVRPDEKSPKICEEWKRAGGRVEDLR